VPRPTRFEGAEAAINAVRSPKQKKLWRSCFESELPNPYAASPPPACQSLVGQSRAGNLRRPFSPVYPVAAGFQAPAGLTADAGDRGVPLNKEPGLGTGEAADKALEVARETEISAIGNALSRGLGRALYSGNEGRVITVRTETNA